METCGMMKTTNGVRAVRVVWACLEGKKEPVASVGSHHGPSKTFRACLFAWPFTARPASQPGLRWPGPGLAVHLVFVCLHWMAVQSNEH